MNAATLRSQLSLEASLELVEHCPAAVAMFDREMKYLAVSRRFMKDYGLVENPVGQNHYALYPDLPEAWRRAHQRGLAGEVVTSDATEPFRRSPTQLDWVNWEVRPWHTSDGAIGGIILFFEVVTATHNARVRDNAVFDQASVGVMRVETKTGTILDVNERFARSLGYSPVELIGWSWMSITHPDDLGNVGAVRAAMDRGDSYQTEKRYLCKDGTPWWAHVTVNPIATPGALEPEQVAFVVDINARKRAEAAEHAANARFRTLFTAASVGMAQFDAQTGLFLDVNAAFANILGCTPDELVGKPYSLLSGSEDLEADTARYTELMRNPRAYTRERWQLRRDGTRVWVEINVTPLWQPGTPPTTYLIVAKDISKRRAAQDAVERSERRFRALIERASDMLLELDADGCVRFWSPAAAEQLGFTSAEMIGRSLVSMICEGDVERAQQALTELRRTPGATARLSWHQETRDGVPLSIAVTARNLLHDPDVGSLVLNLRDQTDEVRLSTQLQQAQKLEGLGRLAGGVAHDFNNLLTVVLICARAIQQALPKEDPSADDITQVLAAAERATGLTRQLLAFARKQVIDPMPLDVNEVVSGTRRMLERLLGEDIRLVADLAPDVGPVFADAGQLEQVLVNLAVNARDAMPRGGRLTISTRNVNDRWVKVSVTDSGTGMPAEVRAHLFEPFFTTKPVGQGTGLGLPTVYGIVTQAGGQIRVDSEVGRGTTFELDFPRSSRSAQSNLELTERELRGSETVVVVEDEAQVRKVIVRVLRRAGYKVLLAEGAREALELIERTPDVGLVLTDVVMPEYDGRWLVQELQRRKLAAPVLFISGYIDDMVSMHGMVDGVELLPKPFTPSSLQERVRRVLDQAAS